MWKFVEKPSAKDFCALADHLSVGEPNQLHPALLPRREMVAEKLRAVAENSATAPDPALYHTLRLLCW